MARGPPDTATQTGILLGTKHWWQVNSHSSTLQICTAGYWSKTERFHICSDSGGRNVMSVCSTFSIQFFYSVILLVTILPPPTNLAIIFDCEITSRCVSAVFQWHVITILLWSVSVDNSARLFINTSRSPHVLAWWLVRSQGHIKGASKIESVWDRREPPQSVSLSLKVAQFSHQQILKRYWAKLSQICKLRSLCIGSEWGLVMVK